MVITERLSGHVIEDVRRNVDGSVTLYCDSGRALCLHVANERVEVKPGRIVVPGEPQPPILPSVRMRLLTAFQGYRIDYAHYDAESNLIFVCAPLSEGDMAVGHREIRLAHNNGIISDLPPVSAIVKLKPQPIFGASGM